MVNTLNELVFSVNSNNFNELAIRVFRFQATNNAVYRKYLDILGTNINTVHSIHDIPFLPISFFKTHKIYIGKNRPEQIFTSSGTTGANTSKHYVAKAKIYEESFTRTFSKLYGSPNKYCILALLPSYTERIGSSLVYMTEHLISESNDPNSGFYLHNHSELIDTILKKEQENKPVLLLGVTFALLELAKKTNLTLKNTIIMGTGEMKGRGKELTRAETHSILCQAFGVKAIHSEYGMTELLSQAYSTGYGIFKSPPWLKIFIRDPYDPFTLLPSEQSGAINVVDLANIYSCSFIQTDDLGVKYDDNSFEITGRMDGSLVRGCNTLVL